MRSRSVGAWSIVVSFVLIIAMHRIRLLQGFVVSSDSGRSILRTPLSRYQQSSTVGANQASSFHQRPLSTSFLRLSAITLSSSTARPYQLVIVESPSKCKTISRILEQYVSSHDFDYDFVVESSMGHIRNLPKSATGQKKSPVLGIDIDNNYQPTYEILPGKEGLVKSLQTLAKGAQKVILATDEDREGEAVAWHLTQVLGDKHEYERVTFTEITPTAIEHAIQRPSSLNTHLVEAQETRRILDRLAGFTLSPLLWKKICPGLSAGRVQSVGMALIVQRERERLLFRPAHYSDMQAQLHFADYDNIEATLTSVNGVQVATGSDFDSQGQLISTHKRHWTATDIEELRRVFTGGNADVNKDGDPNMSTWTVGSIQSKQRKQSPPFPFTTSTLQQEANRKLGMSVSQTMQCAQSLYESGFISYMRTDSTHLSNDAHSAIVEAVSKDYGNDLLAPPRQGKKSKNTQEAHEAIRPAIQSDGLFLRPHQMPGSNSGVSIKLYQLIYQRAVASRMVEQVTNQTSVSVEATSLDGQTNGQFRVSGSVVVAPGYTLVSGMSSSDSILPPFQVGDELDCSNLTCVGHSTQPPPRYNEASFVKELEARGVGRPSTYAGTVKILRDRAYVGTPVRADDVGRRNGKVRTGGAISAQRAAGGDEFTGCGQGPMVPSLSAFVVCSLLEKHCESYVDPEFTAAMEERLDKIARGEEGEERVAYLDEFYAGDDGLAAKVKYIDETVTADEARRADLPALSLNGTKDVNEEVALFIGPYGPYVQKVSASEDSSEKPPSAPLPAGMAADLSTITQQTLNALLASRERDGVLMGLHPDDGRPIRLKIGRFGAYLQWGNDEEEGTTTHSLPKQLGGMHNLHVMGTESDVSLPEMIGLTFDEAVGYVHLPRTVTTLNELPIVASIGPYGPYLKYNNSYVSLNKQDGDVLTVEAETAERVVTEGIINKKSTLGRGVVAELGEKDGAMVRIKDGRFGVYINWKKVNAKLPVEHAENPENIPLDEAWALIEEKGGGGSKSTRPSKLQQVEFPLPPKRPKSSYLIFCAETRPLVAEKVQSLGEVSKELARLWAETTNRQPYEELAAKEKAEYEEKKRHWQADCQALLDESSSTKSRGKSSTSVRNSATAPRKPKSAYLFFCADKRPDVSKSAKSLGEATKELARRWAETADAPIERQKYQDLAAEDKRRYEQEMRAGEASNGKASKIKTTKMEPAANPRAKSAYMLFCSEYRKMIVDENGEKLPFGETTKRLAKLWKECDDSTRRQFQFQATQEKALLQKQQQM